MNIALSTFIIFIFLLPGITFRRFYFTEEFSKQYFKQTFFELFVAAIVPSILLHILLISIIQPLGYIVDFKIIGQLLTSRDYPEKAFNNIQNNLAQIIFYHLTILTISIFLGYFSKKLVRYNRLDSKWKIFRFKNAWHYILTGEFFNFDRASIDLKNDSIDSIDFVHIDALVDTNDGTVIYDGFFVDYELSQDGGLETITLNRVERRLLKNDHSQTIYSPNDSHYKIPGHVLVIPYTSIINLNLTFYKFVEIDNGKDGVEIGFEMVS
jgi:hypothetical protein